MCANSPSNLEFLPARVRSYVAVSSLWSSVISGVAVHNFNRGNGALLRKVYFIDSVRSSEREFCPFNARFNVSILSEPALIG